MRRAAWIVAALAAAAMAGCSSDDDKNPVKPPAGYPALSSPQNVLLALQQSYQGRDTVETKQLYDPNYIGTSQDLNAPVGNQITTFTYPDEVAHVSALRRSTTVVGVTLEFGPGSTWARVPSDDPSHPEWAMIQVPSWRVEIVDGSTFYDAQGTNPLIYAFMPTVAAPGDTTWKIVRWTEVGSGFN